MNRFGNVSIAFPAIEPTIAKRLRLSFPTIPANIEELTENLRTDAIESTVSGGLFFRGLLQAADNSTILILASNGLLEAARTATKFQMDITSILTPDS